MKMKTVFFVFTLCFLVAHSRRPSWRGFTTDKRVKDGPNTRPIVGVLSVPVPEGLHQQFQWADSFIPSSYVKFLEMSGARVVPILINKGDDYYDFLINSINGVLFPGGAVSLQDTTSGYYKAATSIFKSAVKANDNKDHFPIWGTCLGFEMLSILLSPGQKYWLTDCSAEDIALPLVLAADYQKSNMFQNIPSDSFISDLKSKSLTVNFHQRCLTPQNVSASGLNESIHVLSTNKDKNGLDFVSTFEAFKYPFFGVQWHPEKNNFEWSTKLISIPRSHEAIFTSQFFANFFIDQARQSNHKFYSEDAEDKALINNYRTYFTDKSNTTFTEVYLFHKNDIKGR